MTKAELLVAEVQKYLDVREDPAHPNRGPQIEMFQRSTGGQPGDPWCMDLVQFCLAAVGGSPLKVSGHCLTVWNESPIECRVKVPRPGDVPIWRHKGTTQGHAGIVEMVLSDTQIQTIEGNTGPAKIITREGDGVYRKTRAIHPVTGSMELVGFLRPFTD